ncbi:MAG: Txe/YoeB family addiction module toxin [Bacteroidaceae bacterium]|nr:Txe/YoeB family addiction module toxin [Bacteroidaceae bacterium]
MFDVELTPTAVDDLKKLGMHQPKLKKKALAMLDQLEQNPRAGLGKPERLVGCAVETWSRRIDQRHRLVYEIYDDRI